MIRRSAVLTTAVIAAIVFTGTTPAQAADNTAIKRAIIISVLKNLGVDPTNALVSQLAKDLPIDALDAGLVTQVGNALDNSTDTNAVVMSQVDVNGDGIPDADATTDAASAIDDDSTDDSTDDSSKETSTSSGSSSGNSGSSSNSGSGSKPKNPPTDDSTDDSSDDSSDDSNDNSDDDSNDESGDDEDN